MKRYKLVKTVTQFLLVLVMLVPSSLCYAQKTNVKKTGGKPTVPSVYVYLDNTASMKGYQMATNPNVFTGVFAALSQHYASSSIQGRIVKSNAIIPFAYSDLMNGLTNRNISFTDSYQLEDLFKDMVGQVKKNKNSICFLVTDGIPSGTNTQIKKNPNYNIQNTAILSANIASALKPLQNGAYEIGVFQFVSGFKGDYYKYNNSKVSLNDVQRPFYVIAIGDKKLVGELYGASMKNFMPTNKAKYGANSSVSITPKQLRYLVVDKKLKGRQIKVKLTKKTETIPFLIKGLSVDYPSSVICVQYKGKQVPVAKNEFKLDLAKGRKATIKLRIRNTHSKWVGDCSSSDDSQISSSNKNLCGQTFNLSVLLDGILQGINPKGNNQYLFDGDWEILN